MARHSKKEYHLMAKMIPTQIDNEGISSAERRVFGLLESDPATKDWTVLHSLGLARRRSGPYGEIDFVVIVPSEGIICLEVKGGRVSCQGGIWRTMDRHGNNEMLKKSPFLQARDGMFSLRESVIRHFGEGTSESQCPIGCAVVFPDVTCPPLTPEFERSDVIDLDDLRNPISKSIMRVARRRLREFQPKERDRLPTKSEAKDIGRFLRPDFEMVVAKSVSIGHSETRLLRLTEEQYARLDELEANPRCLFEGAAGTGKTLLALEYARRAARAGAKVILVCFNHLLGEWLRQQTENMDITAGTWHGIVKSLILTSSVASEFEEQEREALECGNIDSLFSELYPFYGEVALEEMGAPFDVLVMDEAQDLGHRYMLDFLNLSIHGGLAGGQWAIFGDFTRQALYGDAIEPVEIVSRYSEYFVRAKLTLNCRNTRSIAEETTILSGFDKPPFRLSEEKGLPVEHRYWKTSSDLLKTLTNVVAHLVRDKTPIESIILLSPRRLENSSLAGIERISRFPLVDNSRSLTKEHSPSIKFATIQSFKGLESQVVIIVDIDAVEGEQPQSLLYVAMSRARSLLILMINENARNAVESRIREAMYQELKK